MSYTSLYIILEGYELVAEYLGPWYELVRAMCEAGETMIFSDTTIVYNGNIFRHLVEVYSFGLMDLTEPGWKDSVTSLSGTDETLWYACPDLDYNAIMKKIIQLQGEGASLQSVFSLRSE